MEISLNPWQTINAHTLPTTWSGQTNHFFMVILIFTLQKISSHINSQQDLHG